MLWLSLAAIWVFVSQSFEAYMNLFCQKIQATAYKLGL